MKYKVNEQIFDNLGCAELYSKECNKPIENLETKDKETNVSEVTEQSVDDSKIDNKIKNKNK